MSVGIEAKYLKKSIYDCLMVNKGLFRGVALDVGCGEMPHRNALLSACPNIETYLGLDLEHNYHDREVVPDLVWDGVQIPLPDDSVDCAFATEVLEHCPDPILTLREIKRVLKPGGAFVFTVPFLWPLHEVPNDFYRYTPFSLQLLLEKSGFVESEICMLGGWDASLAQMLGLWVVRRPGMSPGSRKLLTRLLTPLIDYLQKQDDKNTGFTESQMCTGFCGVSKKADSL